MNTERTSINSVQKELVIPLVRETTQRNLATLPLKAPSSSTDLCLCSDENRCHPPPKQKSHRLTRPPMNGESRMPSPTRPLDNKPNLPNSSTTIGQAKTPAFRRTNRPQITDVPRVTWKLVEISLPTFPPLRRTHLMSPIPTGIASLGQVLRKMVSPTPVAPQSTAVVPSTNQNPPPPQVPTNRTAEQKPSKIPRLIVQQRPVQRPSRIPVPVPRVPLQQDHPPVEEVPPRRQPRRIFVRNADGSKRWKRNPARN